MSLGDKAPDWFKGKKRGVSTKETQSLSERFTLPLKLRLGLILLYVFIISRRVMTRSAFLCGEHVTGKTSHMKIWQPFGRFTDVRLGATLTTLDSQEGNLCSVLAKGLSFS